MSARHICHRIERTRNKHSRAVFCNGTIVIRLARNLTSLEEQEHIQSLLRRMTQQIIEDEQKITIDPFRPLLSGVQSLVVRTATGKAYKFSLKAGSHTAARRTHQGWNITIGPRLKRKGLHALLWKLLSLEEEPHIWTLVNDMNKNAFCSHIKRFRLKFASSQWGSCSPKKIVMLNAALLFVPPSVLKYMIVHELAHLRHGNHSQAYWSDIEKAMPRYRTARELLKEYRLPTL